MKTQRFFRSAQVAEKDILQQIVLRQNVMPEAEPIYLRTRPLPGGGLRNETDTFVNIFHKERWEKLTTIRHMALEVTCRGEGRLMLMAAQRADCSLADNNPFQEAARMDLKAGDGVVTVHVSLPENQDFCSFSWEEDIPGALQIIRACFVEEKGEQAWEAEDRDGKVCLALVVATWRRPLEVGRLAGMYRTACTRRKDFARHAHLFIVNNDPAVKETFPLRTDTDLTVLHSPANVGGAGAFALGARTALELGCFSHVVFMDDDILVHEESWFRTLSLLRRLKDACREQIVSGAMLKLEQPCFCHVMQEAIDSCGFAVTLSGDQAVRHSQDVLRLLACVRTETSDSRESGVRPYAAWWYCVLPVRLFASYGFPLPLFFRGDDQEFGLRVGRMTLPLNGIFVWHPAFEQKKSLLRLYLGFRNGAVTALLHLPAWRRIVIRRLILSAWRELLSGRHSACALRVLALEDFMHFFKLPRDGDRLAKRLGKWLAFFQSGRKPPHMKPEPSPFAPVQTARLAALVLLVAWRLWRFDAARARAAFKELMQPPGNAGTGVFHYDIPGFARRFATERSV